MNPAEHKHVIKKALERYRIRMEEVATLGWYKDSTPTDNEIARIDAALAWLEQEPTLIDELRRRIAELEAVITYIDSHAPRADATCAEPGISLSEAARREMKEQAG